MEEALANQYFAFFSIDLAEAITTSGQLVIKWAENHQRISKLCSKNRRQRLCGCNGY